LADRATALVGAPSAEAEAPAVPARRLPRLIVRSVEAPASSPNGGIVAGSVVLVTDEEQGTGERVAAALRDVGARVALGAPRPAGEPPPAEGGYTADLGDERDVAELVSRIRRDLGELT